MSAAAGLSKGRRHVGTADRGRPSIDADRVSPRGRLPGRSRDSEIPSKVAP
jgi:hypothetical protein